MLWLTFFMSLGSSVTIITNVFTVLTYFSGTVTLLYCDTFIERPMCTVYAHYT